MSPTNTYILTCAPAHRVHEVHELIAAAEFDKLNTIVVSAAPHVIPYSSGLMVLPYPQEPLNISKWWNFGADWIDQDARERGFTKWNIIYMESDARLSFADIDLLKASLRMHDVGMAGSDWRGFIDENEDDVRHGLMDVHPVRLPGFALMVRGELGLRHDPELRWWFSDDDFEYQARTQHGTVLVGGAGLYHVGTDGLDSPDKQTYAVEDEIKFKTKWGVLPRELGHD